MRTRVRKTLVLGIKFLIAAALLAWVFSKVSWYDFVVVADTGDSITVETVAATTDGVQLTRPDGAIELRSWDALAPLDEAGPHEVSNYLRPGFFSAVCGIRRSFLVAGMLCLLTTLFLGALRWRGLLTVQDIRISYYQAMRLTWMGVFLNYIVLGTTGGDLVKAYYVAHSGRSKITCLMTVMVDRALGMTGLAALSALTLVIVLLGRGYSDPEGRYTVQLLQGGTTVGIVLLALGVCALFVFSRSLRRRLHLEKLYRRLPLSRYLVAAAESLGRYRHDLRAVTAAMALTLLMHLLWIGGLALMGRSLGLEIPWFQYVIYIPLIYIIAAVPIVPGGVGLAESFFVTFFAAWGGESEVLALALLARLVPMFWSLPGVLVAVTGAKRPSAAEIEAELERGIDT